MATSLFSPAFSLDRDNDDPATPLILRLARHAAATIYFAVLALPCMLTHVDPSNLSNIFRRLQEQLHLNPDSLFTPRIFVDRKLSTMIMHIPSVFRVDNTTT